MAPPIPTPAVKVSTKQEALVEKKQARSTTPSAIIPGKDEAKTITDDKELATVFKSDLTNIRNLVTCSICDQLLYEPWTLGCGHTYCYSCLCNWFIPNKRKKSCPECRTRVKQIPAPNYLVKQMVEVFTKRGELMPSDESIEQHTQKRAEEIAEVERDRGAVKGLFKGAFPANGEQGRVFRDEQDGVWRCPGCHHEHEGGPSCQNCGYVMEDDDIEYDLYSDMDDDADLDSLDLEAEADAELDFNAQRYFDVHLDRAHFGHYHRHHHAGARDYETSDSDNSEMYSDLEDEDGDNGSLDEFVAPDDEEPARSPVRQPNNQANQPITISDDGSDEGGAVSNRIPRRRGRARFSPTPSIITVTDNGTNDSDAGDMNSEAELLRDAGWSPLDHDNDSEAEEQFAFRGHPYGDGYGSSDFGQSDNNSDTETMVGNGGSDDEEDRSREDFSETPTFDGPPYIPHEHINYESLDEDADGDDDDSEAGLSSVYDRDGDTEMSVSPRPSRNASVNPDGYRYDEEMSASSGPGSSVSVNTDAYGEQADYPDESRSERSDNRMTPSDGLNSYEREMYGDLGGANQIHDIEDDSDDDSPRPPRRRQPNRFNQEVRVQQQYNPRISRMFADHQQSLRGAQAHDPDRMVTLAELSEEARRFESRNNRRMNAYRHQPPRRVDPLRSSRSPSANRVVASSSRGSRPPRQYNFSRGYNL